MCDSGRGHLHGECEGRHLCVAEERAAQTGEQGTQGAGVLAVHHPAGRTHRLLRQGQKVSGSGLVWSGLGCLSQSARRARPR